jgi:outer membrane protein TolC
MTVGAYFASRCCRLVVTALALMLTAMNACVPYDPPFDRTLEPLLDRSARPISTAGGSIGLPDHTPVEDAARLLDEQAGDSEWTKGPDGTIELSVDALRSQVLRQTLELRVVDLDVEIASATLNAERAKFDAAFVAQVDLLDAEPPLGNSSLVAVSSSNPALSGASASLTELEQSREQFAASFGLDVPLVTGGKVSLRQALEIDDKSALGLSSTEDRAQTSISISQPLLRNAGTAVNTASIRLASLDLGAVQARTRLAAIRVLAAAEKAYWRVYAAERVLTVRREQLELATENLAQIQRLIDAGDVAPLERFSAELAVAQQIEALVVAETGLRLQTRELSRMLNRPDLSIEDPAAIRPVSEPLLARYDLDRPALIRRALDERLELLELELQLAADAVQIDVARNQTLPVFALEFEYGLADRRGTLASAFSDTFDFENATASVGLGAVIPLTNDAAEARATRAVLNRIRRLATRELRQQAIVQEVSDAADILEQNWQRILASRQSVIAAAASYQVERDLFARGLRSAQDVLIALSQLGDTRQREIAAVVAYQIAQIDLAFATGVLLGYTGTELQTDPSEGASPP